MIDCVYCVSGCNKKIKIFYFDEVIANKIWTIFEFLVLTANTLYFIEFWRVCQFYDLVINYISSFSDNARGEEEMNLHSLISRVNDFKVTLSIYLSVYYCC